MTLAVYLNENFGRIRGAERLTVHPDTVTDRVRHAEVLLGRSIGTETLELRVALGLLPALPSLTQWNCDAATIGASNIGAERRENGIWVS
ncbi:helix-turn-helix domain-containing protein [Nocardia sp. CA-119907]|uniref:helix-turn-helix domain-containing protein n=1 Tax=Nocardia sp. CA-119907 TaxID=3239973 RepID=UPI003D996E44